LFLLHCADHNRCRSHCTLCSLLYADDTQLRIPCDVMSAIAIAATGTGQLDGMTSNCLNKLNANKIQITWTGTRQLLSKVSMAAVFKGTSYIYICIVIACIGYNM